MDKYTSPGVYVESVSSVASVDDSLSTGIGGFVGIAERGPKFPVLISSWQEYIDTFAPDMDSPFLANSSLAFAVYGFFQNGGKRCYVQRAVGEGIVQSSATVSYTPRGGGEAITLFTLKAIEGGAWGNKLSCEFGQIRSTRNYILTIKYNGNTVETFDVTWGSLASAIATSRFVVLTGSIGDEPESDPMHVFRITSEFTGGADSYDHLNFEYWAAGGSIERLNYITILDEVYAKISGEVKTFFDAIATRKETVVVLFSPEKLSPDGADVFGSLPLERIILYYPFVNVPDPLNSGALREVTPVGHVMGVLARIAQERGIWKAPAGTECTLKGVVSVAESVNVGELRAKGVNAIIYKPNYGVVIWGAVTQALNNDMAYVTDVLLDCYIKDAIDTALQPAVFEPNNSALWVRVKADIESILDTLWRAGGLAGSEASQAYYVKCDEELNPESVRDAGELRVEVGYARNRPAEFIIVRVAHSINRS